MSIATLQAIHAIIHAMTGFDCICGSIAIFEKALETGDPGHIIRTSGGMAQLAGYSIYHFARLFFAITGMSPKEYISGRILSRAAKELADTQLPLGAIAQRSGFPDYETFSRAFRNRFGTTPKQVRQLRYIPFTCLERIIPRLEPGKVQLTQSPSQLLDRPAFTLTGLPFFMEDTTTSYHTAWATFMRIQDRVAGRFPPETFYQYSAWTDDEAMGGMSVLCALQTDPQALQEPIFTIKNIPAASYLQFIHTGDVSTLHETYRYIYQSWFACQEIKPLGFWEFQRYPTGEKTTEINIPVALL